MESSNVILSDLTVRTLIVKGFDEVERIRQVNKNKHIFKVESIAGDTYKIELIYRVGDMYNERR